MEIPVSTQSGLKWGVIKKTAAKVLGYGKKKIKELITSGTWHKIGERKQRKAQMLNATSPRLQKLALEAHITKDSEVKDSARNDRKSSRRGASR